MLLRSKLTLVFVFLISLISACAPTLDEKLQFTQSKVMSRVGKKTACISFQGNGVYFSSHVGALISLLENNYEPVFATGGSSGAILASVARALVENPSLRGGDGTFAPQRGALLLASSSPVIESVLFLPRFTTPLELLDSFDVFLSGSAVGVLRADPSDAIVHAESIVGQATLVIDFYRSVDFSEVVYEKNLVERERKVASLWKEFVNAVWVSTDDFADAIFLPRSRLIAEGRTRIVEIQDRFFEMYRSKNDTMLTNFKTKQSQWNELLEGNLSVFGLDSVERRRRILKKALESVRSIESFDSMAATLSGDFMMADPDRVYRAFDGVDSRTGRPIQIPSNVVIHSTARRALKKSGEWHETPGLNSLHQVYFTNPAQVESASKILLEPANNPLKPTDPTKSPVIPTDRLVVTSLELGPVLAASTGEPTAFVRFPIRLDPAARARLNWVSGEESLIGFGGWLEKVSLGTGKKFPQCAPNQVDLYFYTSDGDGVNRFAKMAFLGLFLDKPLRGLLAKQIQNPDVDIRAALSGNTGQQRAYEPPVASASVFKEMLGSADLVFAESRDAQARQGHLPINFNYVNPSQVGGASGDALNTVFRSNRRAMILAAYEFTRRMAEQRGFSASKLSLWNKPLSSVLDKTTPDDVIAIIRDTMPRLSITTTE